MFRLFFGRRNRVRGEPSALRKLLVAAQNRTLSVLAGTTRRIALSAIGSRTLVITAQNRTLVLASTDGVAVIDGQSRTLAVAAQNRTLVLT